jgi:ribosomal protein L32
MPANWTIRTTATCTTNGIEFKKCSRCTHEITQTIPMLNCCKVCGEVDCQIEHKQCEVCGEWDCEIEHNTGIAEIEGVSIKIYPNPVKNELIIDRGQLTINSVEIIDLSGKTIFQFNELRNQINVSALPRGIYFVKVETDKGIVTQKFVKE